MNIDFTNKEFLTLLKAVYLADCVANSYANSVEEEHRDVSRLRAKVFSMATDAGFGELVRYDPNRNDYVESDQLADDIDGELLGRHLDSVFWRQLLARLTDKIMDERFGAEMTGWTDEEYNKHRRKIEKKVERELRANGISNIFLLGDFS